ncbi:nucleoside recognition protein [Halorarius halobius]|uniref:nucleoside recognition protein n=1 Tax=Halorarius halobius TaxID=2962671 RepID=UPI0020CBD7B6|nr:nucleoside recognition protein [Halorarius halobius]
MAVEVWGVLPTVAVRVAKIAAFIAVGVSLAHLLVAFGLVERVAALSKYLTRPANLPDEVGGAIVTTAASTTAGYGMLAEFRESGRLSDRATLVAVTINTFFGFVQHIFTFYAPVLIPILGLRVGLMYVGARAAISLAITLTGVAAGALLLAGERPGTDPVEADGGTATEPTVTGDHPETLQGKLEQAGRKGYEKTRDILPRLAIIYAAVALLTANVDITQVTAAADPLATTVGLPAAAVPVVAVFALDTTNGAIVIAPLVPGTFTPEQAVATMLVGGVVSFAVTTFKRSIPFQYGIWGAEFGSKVVAVNTALKVVFIAAAVALLLY